MPNRKRARTVSATEFDRAAAICRMTESSVALARAVLVEGHRQSDVARSHSTTRQWVSEVVRKMRGYLGEANPIPPGWRADVVVLPEERWPEVREVERAARALLRHTNKR